MTALLALLALFAQQTAHQHHPPRDAAEYAKVLENPERDAWQKPHEVIMALKIRPDEVIADLGAGSGYFSRRLANHAGTVYAVDIDPKLLAMVEKAGAKNVKTVLATADDPKLPPASVDTVFICDVLHHIENRPGYYAKLAKALKPGGRIVNIDFYKKKLPIGPPEAMKLSEEQVIGEFAAAGFKKTAQHGMLPYQYFLVFGK
ncbi:MAG: methyltransferase domain-containing protein [Acidobacteria bacterium]|nr:methyltransferase domain-containing protein [Acidobacteriota bacterium]